MSTHYTHYLSTLFQCTERGNNSSLDCHHFRLKLRTWVAPTFTKLCMGYSSTTHMMGEDLGSRSATYMQFGLWHYKVGYLGFRVTRLYHWKVRKLNFLEELNCSCLGLVQQTHNLSFPLKHKCSLLINLTILHTLSLYQLLLLVRAAILLL
jgi:hypothetical protein